MNTSHVGRRDLHTQHPVRQPPRRTTLYRNHAPASSRTTALREPYLELHAIGNDNSDRSRPLNSNVNVSAEMAGTFNIGAGLQNERTELRTMADDGGYTITPSGISDVEAAARRQSVRSIVDARRPAPEILAERLAAEELSESATPADERERHLQREARRRTIYVPDDTTVMTIHPGASLAQRAARRGSVLHQSARRKSQALPNETQPVAEPEAVVVNVESRPRIHGGTARNVRRTSIAGPPKRIHRPMRDMGLPTLNEDSPKRGHSAVVANVPPSNPGLGSRAALGRLSTNKRVHENGVTKLKSKTGVETGQLLKKRAVRMSLAPMHARKGSDDKSQASLAIKVVKALSSSNGVLSGNDQIKHHISSTQSKAQEPLDASLNDSKVTRGVYAEKFALLQDDLEKPQLYEDKWLDHQEIALTQLLNAFFDAAALTNVVDYTHKDLRSAMIKLYNDQDTFNLVKRLQASLIYGSLSVPQEVLDRNIRLTDDVGQRRRFLNIFLDAYSLPQLRAAAEAIAGRQCSRSSRASSESASGSEREVVSKREVEDFLDTFFVRHEDVDVSKTGSGTIDSLTKEVVEPVGSKTWAWRRTVVRSLMLVLLLDKAKASKATKGCLFQSSSDLKSSEAVIKTLGEILLPSYGDLMRPLRHLRYDISVAQHPLEEFNYKVENIATDLRDGIRLTKVVEILLDECRRVSGSDASGSLAESLKLPCTSRTQKLQNVMIALGAVVRLKSIPEDVLKETTAFDIVDGHREKTLSLLWALLGQYSVDCMIDWNLLRTEYHWAQSQLTGDSNTHIQPSDAQVTTVEESWSLLTHWAKSLAALDAVPITNLTTSFADGRAFTAIIKAYLPYLPTPAAPLPSAPSPAATLRALGCTPSFAALLSSASTTIPTRAFTLAALTFLAARLLPAARAHRAAVCVQRAYRVRLARRAAHRRAVAMRLARHCAAVVGARDRVVWAARVIQRAWRAVLAAKIGLLERDVRGFQALARGWLVRARRTGRPRFARAGW